MTSMAQSHSLGISPRPIDHDSSYVAQASAEPRTIDTISQDLQVSYESTIRHLRRQIEQSNRFIDQLESTARSTQSQYTNATIRLTDISKSLRHAQANLEQVEDHAARTESELLRECNKLREEIESIRARYTSSKAQKRQQEQDLDLCRLEIAHERRAWTVERQKYNRRIDLSEQRLQLLAQEITRLQSHASSKYSTSDRSDDSRHYGLLAPSPSTRPNSLILSSNGDIPVLTLADELDAASIASDLRPILDDYRTNTTSSHDTEFSPPVDTTEAVASDFNTYAPKAVMLAKEQEKSQKINPDTQDEGPEQGFFVTPPTSPVIDAAPIAVAATAAEVYPVKPQSMFLSVGTRSSPTQTDESCPRMMSSSTTRMMSIPIISVETPSGRGCRDAASVETPIMRDLVQSKLPAESAVKYSSDLPSSRISSMSPIRPDSDEDSDAAQVSAHSKQLLSELLQFTTTAAHRLAENENAIESSTKDQLFSTAVSKQKSRTPMLSTTCLYSDNFQTLVRNDSLSDVRDAPMCFQSRSRTSDVTSLRSESFRRINQIPSSRVPDRRSSRGINSTRQIGPVMWNGPTRSMPRFSQQGHSRPPSSTFRLGRSISTPNFDQTYADSVASLRLIPNKSLEEMNASVAKPDSQDSGILIDAIASTVLGEWMWKCPRKGNISFNASMRSKSRRTKQKRWFWISLDDRTIMWSSTEPRSHAALSGTSARKLSIQTIFDVKDLHPCRAEHGQMTAFDRFIIVQTPQRTLRFNAPTAERHYAWLMSLSYIADPSQRMLIPRVPAGPAVHAKAELPQHAKIRKTPLAKRLSLVTLRGQPDAQRSFIRSPASHEVLRSVEPDEHRSSPTQWAEVSKSGRLRGRSGRQPSNRSPTRMASSLSTLPSQATSQARSQASSPATVISSGGSSLRHKKRAEPGNCNWTDGAALADMAKNIGAVHMDAFVDPNYEHGVFYAPATAGDRRPRGVSDRYCPVHDPNVGSKRNGHVHVEDDDVFGGF